MKKQSTSLLTQISTEEVKNLTSIVKETIATDLTNPKRKIFTASDLWNIQRQRKNRI
ncbi:MAG TPA: hypothetical protein VJU78_01660 [Chitinophagaceae bacterium]|nr:hypothetical protein [Chitinophagaceae bacterium]